MTGGSGVSITRYTVTVDGQISQTVSHDNDRDIFSIIVAELDYNTTYDVTVIAINSCGLSSSPATTNISIFNSCGLSSSPATTNISLFKSKSKVFICGSIGYQ